MERLKRLTHTTTAANYKYIAPLMANYERNAGIFAIPADDERKEARPIRACRTHIGA